jgi:succinoglycan biosynthesis transport protein ExoP
MDVPLNFNRPGGARFDRETPTEDSFTISEVIEQLSGFVRRQFPIFVFIASCCVALGLVYLLTTPPSFTSHAMLLIDSSKVHILQQPESPLNDLPIDTAQVETQVEILKSESIGLSVVKDLKLNSDPEFTGAGGGLIGRLRGLFGSTSVPSDDALTRRALSTFLADRSIVRVGRTYVLNIGYTSYSPKRSAEVANAIADAYIVDQLASKYQATKRASVWLQDRIKELRQQASDADRAVLDYKEKNKIVSVGGSSPTGGGRLLGDQQLEDLNTQLGTARAATEEAKARLDRINDVMKKDALDPGVDATVTDSLKSEVINRLRSNYLDLAAKEAIWSARYGENHLAAVNLRTQMAELRRSIFDELGRIAQGYKSDYEISKSRVDGLEQEIQKLVARSQVTNRDRLGLTDLESTAKIYHSIYDNFLQRYMEAIQQQSFPITEARVISAAAPPQVKSSPLSYVVLGSAGFIGLVLSFGAAIMREAVDRVFRTSRRVETVLHANCIAVLPMLADRSKPTGRKTLSIRRAANSDQEARPEKATLAAVSAPVGATREASVLALNSATKASQKRPFMSEVVDEPLSAFAEAFRGIKVAADISGNRVIGITSTLPGEGKSTIASNLAQLIAHGGNRVVLLDGDLRNPSLTRAMASDAKTGLLEVINGQASLESGLYTDEITGLAFLPVVREGHVLHTHEIVASTAFRNLVENLRKAYDYVIIDFPPLVPVVDVRATTQIVDSYIYVVEWGKTRMNLVQDRLLGCPEIHERLLGVVLNKANVDVLERYESYYGKNYYRRHYGDRYQYTSQV